MGIFKDMHELRHFESDRQHRELRRMLSEAIERGYVEQIPVGKRHPFCFDVEWYRDKETGEIYSLMAPDERIRGHWEKVDLEDLSPPNDRVQ